MKKLLSLCLTVVIMICVVNLCYAEPENVNSSVYQQEPIIINDLNPEAPADEPTVIEEKEPVPAGDTELPKTGGIPPQAFYVAGALLVAAGILIPVRKTKTSSAK